LSLLLEFFLIHRDVKLQITAVIGKKKEEIPMLAEAGPRHRKLGGRLLVMHGSPLCHGIAVARIGLRFCSLDNND
jgi:hypothetical protein